jgi:hypothetical protein
VESVQCCSATGSDPISYRWSRQISILVLLTNMYSKSPLHRNVKKHPQSGCRTLTPRDPMATHGRSLHALLGGGAGTRVRSPLFPQCHLIPRGTPSTSDCSDPCFPAQSPTCCCGGGGTRGRRLRRAPRRRGSSSSARATPSSRCWPTPCSSSSPSFSSGPSPRRCSTGGFS